MKYKNGRMRIEYQKRPDGLWNKWEQLHPGLLFHDITIFEEDAKYGRDSYPVWVVTDVTKEKGDDE